MLSKQGGPGADQWMSAACRPRGALVRGGSVPLPPNLNLKPAAGRTAARHGTVTPAARTTGSDRTEGPGPGHHRDRGPSRPQTVDVAPRRLEPSLPAPGLR